MLKGVFFLGSSPRAGAVPPWRVFTTPGCRMWFSAISTGQKFISTNHDYVNCQFVMGEPSHKQRNTWPYNACTSPSISGFRGRARTWLCNSRNAPILRHQKGRRGRGREISTFCRRSLLHRRDQLGTLKPLLQRSFLPSPWPQPPSGPEHFRKLLTTQSLIKSSHNIIAKSCWRS